jgi:hypothetical protein
MFENFRKNVANTTKELPKEERPSFIDGVQNAPAKEGELNTYGKAKAEHLEQAEIKQGVWAEKLEQQKKEVEKKAEIERKVAEATASIAEIKKLGINTDAVEKELNALLNPAPENTIEILGKKIEVGPYLGEFDWNAISAELDKLNKTLKAGEKEWRILSKEEYKELEKQTNAIWNDKVLSDTEKKTKFNEFITGLGFAPGRVYWSSTEHAGSRDFAYIWNTYYGDVSYSYKGYKLSVQAVR